MKNLLKVALLLMMSAANNHRGADLSGGPGCAHLRVGHPCNKHNGPKTFSCRVWVACVAHLNKMVRFRV